MVLKSFAEEFYEALKDPKIRQELASISKKTEESGNNNVVETGLSNENQSNNISAENIDWNSKCKVDLDKIILKHQEEIENLKSEHKREIENLKLNNDDCLKELQIKIEKQEIRLEYYIQTYDRYEHIIECLNSLSSESRNSIENYFPETSVDCIISAGGDRICVEGMWEFIKFKILDHNNKDIESLKEIMSFLFDVYKKHNGKNAIELFSPEIGSAYNTDNAINIFSSSEGVIKSVLMPGYRSINTGRIIKKALVEV